MAAGDKRRSRKVTMYEIDEQTQLTSTLVSTIKGMTHKKLSGSIDVMSSKLSGGGSFSDESSP